MMRRKILFPRITGFLPLTIFITSSLSAQESGSAGSIVDKSRAHALSFYTTAVRDQLLLFNGVEYKEIPEPYEGTPFFGVDEDEEDWEYGSVRYFNEVYQDVPLKYDKFRDELIIEHFDQKGFVKPVKLHQEMVSDFTLFEHTFIRVAPTAYNVNGLRDGFYDLLHDGNVKVLAKRKVNMYESVSTDKITRSFVPKEMVYIVRDGVAYTIRGKGSALKVMKESRKALNQYANRARLNFVEGFERSVVQLVEQFEELQRSQP